jgi:cyclic-di-GMP phosphodiesterase TipF (flagellum assembly factor)
MLLLGHLVFIAAYAVAAVFLALALPDQVPAIGHSGAFVVGGFVFVVAALVHEVVSRRFGQQSLLSAVMMLHRGANESAADVEALRNEVSRLRRELGQAGSAAKQKIDSELEAVKLLLGQLAARLGERNLVGDLAAASGPERDPPPVPSQAAAQVRPVGPSLRVAAANQALASALEPSDEILSQVRTALEHNRLVPYLQPIVTLPQRKIRFFEAYSRLGDAEGRLILPDRYVPVAVRAGLIGTIDSLMLFRCVQMIRKLKARNRHRRFFCNLSLASLHDDVFFTQFADFLRADWDLPQSLIFEVTEADLKSADPKMRERLSVIAAQGFSLSLDRVGGLELDYAQLARQNFRFVKIQAQKLIARDTEPASAKALAELAENLRQQAIDLIAEKIENERALLAVLDYGVDYGQGYLFGEPRPVREDF